MTWTRLRALAKFFLLASTLLSTLQAQEQLPFLEQLPASEHSLDPTDMALEPESADDSASVLSVKMARELAALADYEEELPAPAAAPAPTAAPAASVPIDARTELALEGGPNLHSDIWSFCSECCDSGLILGAEATFLAPFGEPQQTVSLTNLLTGEELSGSSDPGFGAGIRSWIGIQRCGWGFRFQYWHFGNQVIDVNPVVPMNANPTFNEQYYLSADTIDLELTQRLCLGAFNIDTSFGARYARLERNSTVVGYGDFGDVSLYGLAMGANKIEGTGFTFSIVGQKPIVCCWVPCGWNWFWKYRGALLWADSKASALTEANAVVNPPFGAGAGNSRDKATASKDHSEDVFISEVQLGIEYQRCLCCLPATFFFRAAFEYHHWETGDVIAGSNSFAFLQGGGPPAFGGRVDAFANAHDGDLDLIGFTLGAGLNY